MPQDEIVTYPTAKLAKEKNFDLYTFEYYTSEGERSFKIEESNGESEYRFDYTDFEENWNQKNLVITKDGSGCFGCKQDNVKYFESFSAPTQTGLQTWLRVKHKIHLTVIHRNSMADGNEYYDWLIEGMLVCYRHFTTWEQALENGLLEALRLIK
jgi:hypothetical protein